VGPADLRAGAGRFSGLADARSELLIFEVLELRICAHHQSNFMPN
jgi:hypothetical protein